MKIIVFMFFITSPLFGQKFNDSIFYYHDKKDFNKALLFADTIKIKFGNNSYEYATSLKSLGIIYQREGNYEKAIDLHLKSIEIQKAFYTENQEDYLTLLNNLANCYSSLGNYNKAEKIFIEALSVSKPNNLDYATIQTNLGKVYNNLGDFKLAEEYHKQSIEIFKDILGENHSKYRIAYGNLASNYIDQYKFSEAEIIFKNNLSFYELHDDKENPEYLTTLNNLGYLYKITGKYELSEIYYLKSYNIRKIILGENHPDFMNSENNLAELYRLKGDYKKAERILQELTKKRKELLGENNIDYLMSLNNLAVLYDEIGEFDKAEVFHLEGLNTRRQIFGDQDLRYAISLSNVGLHYKDKGDFMNAEEYYIKSLNIRKNILGTENLDYSTSLNNLGMFYIQIKNYTKAQDYLMQSLAIKIKILGNNHIDCALVLNNLAVLYLKQGKYIEAEFFAKNNVDIIIDNLGTENLNYADAIHQLASCQELKGDSIKAEELYLSSLEIKTKVLNENHPEFISTYNNLAVFYLNINNYDKSKFYALKALKLIQNSYGVYNDRYLHSLYNSIILYDEMNDDFMVEELILQISIPLRQRFLRSINFLSVKEQTNYYKSFEAFRFFPLSYIQKKTNLSGGITTNSYEIETLVKSLSLRNQQRIKNNILKTKDTILVNSYTQFINQKKQLTQWDKLPLSDRPQAYEQLDIDTEKLEKYLSRNSSDFATSENALSINFSQVQEKLKSNEIIIDLVAYNYYDTKWTDSIMYSAFIIGKNYISPKYIPLFEQHQLDSLLNQTGAPEASINKLYTGLAISDLFIASLSKELEGITTIFIVPSGLGHQIDFAALPFSENKTLGEVFKVHLLGSSSSLINYDSIVFKQQQNLELLLYGDIDYDKQSAISSVGNDIVITEVEDDFMELVSRSGINTWSYLPGTAKEVTTIKKQSNANGYAARIINGTQATKSSILQLDGKTTPFVLHLATHGYFFENPTILEDNNLEKTKPSYYKASEDSMLRSGLVFSGVNTYWGEPIKSSVIDDGILTAKEISNLDLSSCQLVVLSACETGLGDINGSEGVFGLQRAFKMAGVKNIIMSLWKVPDAQTAELFELFYGYCFQGESVHESLRMAQGDMKKKYSPYYWAGFVLLE
ncbi:CHAT domain-containing protein [Bizionia arctica]|nr:tetratricopeptide repeat protein [Bizionia arctica]